MRICLVIGTMCAAGIAVSCGKHNHNKNDNLPPVKTEDPSRVPLNQNTTGGTTTSDGDITHKPSDSARTDPQLPTQPLLTSWYYDPKGPRFQYDRFRKGCFDSNSIKGLNVDYIGECADLKNTDLSNKDLRNLSFRGSDFSGAKLFNADFTGADLRAANLFYTNWEGANFKDSIYSKETSLPFTVEVANSLKFVAYSFESVDANFKFLMNEWIKSGSPAAIGRAKQLIELHDADFLMQKGFFVSKAIETSQYQLLDFLLARGLKLNDEYKFGRTLLSVAIVGIKDLPEALQMSTYLLDKGADVNAQNSDGKNALWLAMSRRSAELVKLFVSRGGNANVVNSEGKSLLASGIIWRELSTEMALLLLNGAADSNYCYLKTAKSCSLMELAFLYEKPDLVRLFLENGASPAVSYEKPSLLDYTEDQVLLQMMVSKGAPTEKASLWFRKKAKTVEYLVRAGAKIDSSDSETGTTFLLESVKSANHAFVSLAVSLGADVNLGDQFYNSPLSYAISAKSETIVSLLQSNGAKDDVSLNSCSSSGHQDLKVGYTCKVPTVNTKTLIDPRFPRENGYSPLGFVQWVLVKNESGRKIWAARTKRWGNIYVSNVEASPFYTATRANEACNKVEKIVQGGVTISIPMSLPEIGFGITKRENPLNFELLAHMNYRSVDMGGGWYWSKNFDWSQAWTYGPNSDSVIIKQDYRNYNDVRCIGYEGGGPAVTAF